MNIELRDELAATYYDFYKEVHGIRPRWMNFDAMTVEELEADLKRLQEDADIMYARQLEEEGEAVFKFEKHVQLIIESGAKDRETALRWIMDGSDANGDWDYLAYLNNLPFNYFKSKH